MNVLKAKKYRADYKLVGVSLPPQVHNEFTLYTIAKGITKSSVFRSLLDDWLEKQNVKQSYIILFRDIVRRVENEWIISKSNGVLVSFPEFIETVEKELLRKGLNASHVESILELLKDAESKKTRTRATSQSGKTTSASTKRN